MLNKFSKTHLIITFPTINSIDKYSDIFCVLLCHLITVNVYWQQISLEVAIFNLQFTGILYAWITVQNICDVTGFRSHNNEVNWWHHQWTHSVLHGSKQENYSPNRYVIVLFFLFKSRDYGCANAYYITFTTNLSGKFKNKTML